MALEHIRSFVKEARAAVNTAALMGNMDAVREVYQNRCLNEEGNVNAVIGFIVIAAVLMIGIPVIYSISTATPVIPESNPLNATQASLLGTITSGYGLLVVSLIVIAMVTIIGLLMAFGGGKR